MAKIEFRKGIDVRRFVRDGDRVEIGAPNTGHETIAIGMGMGKDRADIISRLKNSPDDKDMGMLMRMRDKVQVFDRSSSFKFPPKDRVRTARDKTVSILSQRYNDENFVADYEISDKD